jgi:hypothetical protein
MSFESGAASVEHLRGEVRNFHLPLREEAGEVSGQEAGPTPYLQDRSCWDLFEERLEMRSQFRRSNSLNLRFHLVAARSSTEAVCDHTPREGSLKGNLRHQVGP